jgi:hypothetical protein
MLFFLFKPWRDESQLIHDHSSYENAFKFYLESNEINVLLTTQFLNEELTEEKQDESNHNNEFLFEENHQISSIMMDININSFHFNDEIKLEKDIKKLNSCQKEVFVDVIDNIKHQELHKTKTCCCSTNREPLVLFTSGVGGNQVENFLAAKLNIFN